MATATLSETAHLVLAKRAAKREMARRDLKHFLEVLPPGRPYYFGRHTIALCDVLTDATKSLERGVSRYIIFICPPRHGKSDIVSRRYPVWHLGRNPQQEVILVTYGANLSERMSKDARRCFTSDEYRSIFPHVISPESRSVSDWSIEGYNGSVHAVGIEGAITGHGAHALVIDDYYKSRIEAESIAIRDSVWDAFRSDLMTRLAPVHTVVIVANRWHADDLVGRVLHAMDNEVDFPKFELHRFPAQSDDGKWLFPERFSAEWYDHEKALVGTYGWESQYQGNPHVRSGTLFATDRIDYYTEPPEDLIWVRFWDLASTKKERLKDDPDYTVGALVGMRRIRARGEIPEIFIDDVRRGQWAAPERDRQQYNTAMTDGPRTVIAIETVGGYKDAGEYAREVFKGQFKVVLTKPTVDKVARATPLEPLFEARRVHMRRAYWNPSFITELIEFPSARHDDQVDGLSGAYGVLLERCGRPRPSTLVAVMGRDHAKDQADDED